MQWVPTTTRHDKRHAAASRGAIARIPLWVRLLRHAIETLPWGRYRSMNTLLNWFCRFEFTRRPFIARHERFENLAFVCHLQDGIAREVCFMGLYEALETALVRRLVRAGAVVLDVGANWGYFTLLSSRLAGAGGRVISFEPDPRLFALLVRNLELNDCQNVCALRIAAADTHSTLSLLGYDESQGNWGLSRIQATQAESDHPTFAVEGRAIDSVLAEKEIGQVDLLKLDVEGGENEALRGLSATLSAGRCRYVLLELHPRILAERGVTLEQTLSPLRHSGYRGWWIDHSPAVTRAASYKPVHDLRPLLRPIDSLEAPDAWPHALWIRPSEPFEDLFAPNGRTGS